MKQFLPGLAWLIIFVSLCSSPCSAEHPRAPRGDLEHALSTKTIDIEHATLICNKTFEETRTALEASVPPLNTTYGMLLAAGDVGGALRAMESLPVLNSFIVPPRNFGNLLHALNKTAKAIQYEIGNPYTAVRMGSMDIGVVLYGPIRVLLTERDGVAVFEYDRPRSTLGQFQNDGVNRLAKDLDQNLTAVLKAAAGW